MLDGGLQHLHFCLVQCFNKGLVCGPRFVFDLSADIAGKFVKHLTLPATPTEVFNIIEPLEVVDYALDGCHKDIILLWNDLVTLSFRVCTHVILMSMSKNGHVRVLTLL